jgi:glycosyltransferase involved in cell wall biosynthesis
VEAGRWFQDPASLAVARWIERELYNRASAVVSLTELAAADVRMGRFGRRLCAERSICIPTSVDFEKFSLERQGPPNAFLCEGPIIAYVGSLNASYEYRRSVQLASLILQREPKAKFLALTGQTEPMESLADQFAIPPGRRLVTRVAYDEIHRWLPWIDVGLILRVSFNRANRASMPTKLGEFFASGVAPITHGANSEIAEWVRKTGSGLALDDLSDASLERAADFAVSGRPDLDALVRARLTAERHFSLDTAAHRYDALFQRVLS